MSNPNWTRFDEKLRKILYWLSLFRFSDYNTLSRVIDLPDSNNRRFFKQLIDRGYLKTFHRDCVRQKLYMLTAYGKEDARSISRFANSYNTDSSKILNFIIVHDLLLQNEVLNFCSLDDSYLLLPSKLNEKYTLSKIFGINPDCLIINTQKSHIFSLELERSTKKYKDRMWLFQRYVEALRSYQVHDVIMCFNNESRLNTYLKDFKQETWPVYKKSNGYLKKLNYPKTISRRKLYGYKDLDKQIIPEKFKDRFHFIIHNQSNPTIQPKVDLVKDELGELEFTRLIRDSNKEFKLLPSNRVWTTQEVKSFKKKLMID